MRIKLCSGAVAFWVLWAAGGARAELLKVERQVLLPGGKPAAGARVLLRSLKLEDGSLKQEKRAVADDKGIVHAEIDIEPDDANGGIRVTGYMMVDAPGMALAFEGFDNWRRRRDVEPLVLGSGYEVKGKVQAKGGEPVAGATIMLAAFASNWSNWRINYPSAGIQTPEATARSGPDGSFSLRPVDIVQQTFGNGSPVVRPILIAQAQKNGVALTGLSEPIARRVDDTLKPPAVNPPGANPPAANAPENVLGVYPAATVRGRVVSAVGGAPIAGAKVELRADPGDAVAALMRPATSKADGSFEWTGVPATFQMFAEARQENFAMGWARIGEERRQVAGDEPRLIENVEVRLRPWAPLSGRVLDVATKAPPLTPISIAAIYDEGYDDGRIAVGRGTVGASAKPDGAFEMKVPVGYNHLMVRGAGYWEGGREHPIDLDVKPAGSRGLTLEVRRQKGFLVRFVAPAAAPVPAAAPGSAKSAPYDFDREYDLHIRGADGKESSTNWGEWWYRPLYKPEDTLEIRVTHFVDGFPQEVVPWTKLSPQSEAPGDAGNWPRVIRLPLRQTITVRGKVVDAATGQPVPNASVKLVTLPAEASAKVAPMVSGADGSFSFERVPLPESLGVLASPPAAPAAPAHHNAAPNPAAERTARLNKLWADQEVAKTAATQSGPLAAAPTAGDVGHQELAGLVVKVARQ